MKVLSKTTRLAATVAAGALALVGALVAPVAANAAGDYYPSGPQVNVSLSTVTKGGWVLCWSGEYGNADSTLGDIWSGTAPGSVSACDSDKLMVTGWATSDPSNLVVLATADASEIKTTTAQNVPHLANGTYWYFTTDWSFGYSPNDIISQDSCDSGDQDWSAHGGQQEKRLCWHLGQNNRVASGYSLGTNEYQFNSSFTRAIFKQIPPTPIHKGAKVNAGALSRIFNLTAPAGGSLVVSLSDDSSASCRVSGGKLYAFASGPCTVTLTALKANSDVKATVTKKFLVN